MDKIIEVVKSVFPNVEIRSNSNHTQIAIQITPTPIYGGKEYPASIVVSNSGKIGVRHQPDGYIWKMGARAIKSPIVSKSLHHNMTMDRYTTTGDIDLSSPLALQKQTWIDLIKNASTVLEDMLKN